MAEKTGEFTECLLIHVPKLLIWDPVLGWHSRVNFLAMGMFSLAEELEYAGIKSHILHLGVEKILNPKFSLSEYIKKSDTSVAAFSLHWHPQTFDTIEAARQLKLDVPEVFIVLGGYTAGYFAREILENYPWIDAVIRGEGEKPLSHLVRAVLDKNQRFSDIPNLTWRNDEGQIMENPLTYVADHEDINSWHFSNIEKIRNYEVYFNLGWVYPWAKEMKVIFDLTGEPTLFGLSLGRGCLGTCTWCGGSYASVRANTGRCGTVWRTADMIEANIRKAVDHGVQRFYICFDPAPKDQSHHIELFEKLGSVYPRIKVDFECFGLPAKEFITSFRRNLHPESIIYISPEIYDENLRKTHRSFYFTNTELEETLERLNREKIFTVLYFTMGVPGEDLAGIKATQEYQKYLKNKFSCIKSIKSFALEIEPGAPWYEEPEKFYIRLKRKSVADFYEAHRQKSSSPGYDTASFKEAEILKLYSRLLSPVTPTISLLLRTFRFIIKPFLFRRESVDIKLLRNHRLNS